MPRHGLRLRSRLFLAGIGLLFVVGIALVVGVRNPSPAEAPPERQVSVQGRQHVVPGQSHPPYNPTPPTSGWHYAITARWGVHASPIPDELQVHNLEHGGILVQYSCADCPELVAQLEGVVKRYRSKVILAPYPDMPQRISLTAWGKIAELEDFDEGTIVRFIETYRNKGPETVPD
jgi:hypothetical protein